MREGLVDTNVIAALAAPNGAPGVKAWTAAQDEERLFLSVITLAEYGKCIHQLRDDDPRRARYSANRDAIEGRFTGRVLPLSNNIVRCWGSIPGRIRRDTGYPPPMI